MTLYVRFRYQIQPILVTEVVPAIVIRIMTCTYRIDIQPFHQMNILYHPRFGHYISFVRIHFVTIDSFEKNGLSVNEQLGVSYFYPAETDLYRYCFRSAARI